MSNLARATVLVLLTAALTIACEEEQPSTVTVPVAGGDISGAYSTLHAAGLRVTVPEPFGLSALVGQEARLESPRAGAVVPRGTVAVLRPTMRGPIGSPAWFRHKDRLPNFVGLTLTEATSRIEQTNLFWEIKRLPPLPPSDAEHLFDAYVVQSQDPKPGDLLAPGILHRNGGFEVTPVRLTVAAAHRSP